MHSRCRHHIAYPSATASLPNGTRLDDYEILSPIGAGGMGEVYRAVDTRLGRKVAIKVLPGELAAEPLLRARFVREAKLISQLSHPNICALFDVGDGYLVMELLDGELLADRLARGPLPLDQALRTGIEIASALHCAHRAGIIHRDVKPGNVMLTRSGAKLLDFGLAKFMSTAEEKLASEAKTEQHPLTEEGTVVGTFCYMSPEQVAGGAVDLRSDIFAFGTLLYEIATGRRAFAGTTRASVAAAILHDDPPPISDLQPGAPRELQRIIASCLAKDPEERWQSAHDVALELKALQDQGPASPERGRPARWSGWKAAAAIVVIAGALAAGYWGARNRTAARSPIHLGVNPPPGMVIDDFVLSPRGDMAALLVSGRGQSLLVGRESSLWVRDLTTDAVRQIPQSEHTRSVCWSPDDKSIAFIARDALYKVAASGGPPVLIRDGIGFTIGLSWGAGDTIVFARDADGTINSINAVAGAKWSPITRADRTHGVAWHTWPFFLPDGRHFLYLLEQEQREKDQDIYVGSLDPKEAPRRVLSGVASNALYAAGQILFIHDRTLMAQPFDETRLTVSGAPRVVADQIAENDFYHYVFTASADGALGYSTFDPRSRLHLVDRNGKEIASFGEPADWVSVSWSPDSQRALVERTDAERYWGTLWMADLRGGGIFSEFATSNHARSGIWSANGAEVLYQDDSGVFVKRADGSGNRALPALKTPRYITTWNGDWVAAEIQGKADLADIEAISISSGRQVPIAGSTELENAATFAPSGKWVAYVADGRVIVQPFPPTGAKFNVSPARGGYPRWRGDGLELYYVNDIGQLLAVPITLHGDQLESGTPQVLFAAALKNFKNRIPYDVSPDGQRFLLNVQDNADRAAHIILNWSQAKTPSS